MADPKPKNILRRQLSLFDSMMIMMGIVLGAGIFITTGIMAKTIPSASLILIAWLVGGLFTLSGALTYAELGASMPEAGGQYVYLRKAFGPLPGFLCGWILFLVYFSGGIAGLSVAFAEYFGYFFPNLSLENILFKSQFGILGLPINITLSAGKLVGAAVIILLTAVIYLGTGPGKIIQNILSIIKIGVIIAIIILGFTIGQGTAIDFSINPTSLSFGKIISGFGIALMAVFWTFDGWNNISFVAGEIKNPQKNIPRALIFGTLLITVLYLLINYIYLYALPVTEMSGVIRVAEEATTILFGGATAAIISAAVLVSTFGSINGSILVGPRIIYAMAKDGLFFKSVSKIHPKFGTPSKAILIQGLLAVILTFSGTFEQLFTYIMFVSVMFWILAAASVFKLRKKFPSMPRPYKTWGYPYVPIIFIIASCLVLVNTLIEKPLESFAGIGITLLGIPVYYY
ncbi:APC family permease, partial [Bacteroidota bacterium]